MKEMGDVAASSATPSPLWADKLGLGFGLGRAQHLRPVDNTLYDSFPMALLNKSKQ